MTKTATVHARVSEETRSKLEQLAGSMNRSKSFLAAEAIEQYVEANAWQVEEIAKAVAEADAGGPFFEHSEVMGYLEARARGENPTRPKPIETT